MSAVAHGSMQALETTVDSDSAPEPTSPTKTDGSRKKKKDGSPGKPFPTARKKPEYMLDTAQLNEALRFPERQLSNQVDVKKLHWDNAAELVSTLQSTDSFTECLKTLGLQLNPLQVALAILESRGVDVSDPGILAQAMNFDFAIAAEYVSEHELATSEAEKRARRLLEADGDENKARAMAVAEYRKLLFEAMDDHIKQARPWERLEERSARRVLEIEDVVEDLEKKRNDSFGNQARFQALEEQILALQHERDSLIYAFQSNAARTSFDSAQLPNRPLSALYPRSGPVVPTGSGSPSAARSAFLLSQTLSKERPGVKDFIEKQRVQRNEQDAAGSRRDPRCPYINLPMLHATHGVHSRKGLMTHTGAICPVLDEAWNDVKDCRAASLRIGVHRRDRVSEDDVSSGPMTQRSDGSDQSLGGYEELVRLGRMRRRSMVKMGSALFGGSALWGEGGTDLSGSFRIRGWGRKNSTIGRHDSFVARQETALLDDMGGLDLDIVTSFADHVKAVKQRESRVKAGLPPSSLAENSALSGMGAESGGMRGELVVSGGGFSEVICNMLPKMLRMGPTGKIGLSSPAFSPILVCCSESEIDAVVQRTVQGRIADLVLVQGGMARSVLTRLANKERMDKFQIKFGKQLQTLRKPTPATPAERPHAGLGSRPHSSYSVTVGSQPPSPTTRKPCVDRGVLDGRTRSTLSRPQSAITDHHPPPSWHKAPNEDDFTRRRSSRSPPPRRRGKVERLGSGGLMRSISVVSDIRDDGSVCSGSRAGSPIWSPTLQKPAPPRLEGPAREELVELVKRYRSLSMVNSGLLQMLATPTREGEQKERGSEETVEMLKVLQEREEMIAEIDQQLRGLRESLSTQTLDVRARDRELATPMDEGEVTIVLLNGRPHNGSILPGGPSYVIGRYAGFVCQMLETATLDCVHVRDPAEFDARAVEKLMVDSALWLLCHSARCSTRGEPDGAKAAEETSIMQTEPAAGAQQPVEEKKEDQARAGSTRKGVQRGETRRVQRGETMRLKKGEALRVKRAQTTRRQRRKSEEEKTFDLMKLVCQPKPPVLVRPGVPGGDILRFHKQELHGLLLEMVHIARQALGPQVSSAMGSDEQVLKRAETMVSAFELAVPCKESAKQTLLYANGWFLSNGERKSQGRHIALLEEQEVNVQLLQLQAERERLSTLKSSSIPLS